MTTIKIKIFDETTSEKSFTFQEGFAALIDEEGSILAATSGWEDQDRLYVYRPTPEGEWVGDWESEDTFPVEEVLDARSEYWRQEEIQKGLRYLENRKPYVSEGVISFTDKVAGTKSRDGGEYGEWRTYTPLPGFPGLYELRYHTTCELVDSQTEYVGIYALTERDYRRMRAKSDRIEKEGFKR